MGKKSDSLDKIMWDVCNSDAIPYKEYEEEFYELFFKAFPNKKWPINMIKVAWLFYNKGMQKEKENNKDSQKIIEIQSIIRR